MLANQDPNPSSNISSPWVLKQVILNLCESVPSVQMGVVIMTTPYCKD